MQHISKINITNVVSTFVKNSQKFSAKFNKKIEGTFIDKFVIYMKNVYRDYKDVAISVRQDIKAKPFKSTLLFTGFGILSYCATHNPNAKSFKAKYIECANDVALIPPDNVNKESVKHLNYIQKCYNHDLIRYNSLLFFSIIWVDKYSNQCKNYESNCSYLQIKYNEVMNRIIDVGFLNIWWVISRKMLDYDINY